MKIFRISLCALLLLAASAAISQTTGVVADVPFSFVVAGRQFPAGHYTVTVWQATSASGYPEFSTQGHVRSHP